MEYDADTTGAVCGQLAGAYWGESGIRRRGRMGWPEKHDREGPARAARGQAMSTDDVDLAGVNSKLGEIVAASSIVSFW